MKFPRFPKVSRSAAFLFALAGLASSTSSPLLAVRVRRLELDELARQAPRVVFGVVTEKTPIYDEETRSVWTEYRLAVHETLKGPETSTIAVRFFGGEVDGHSEGIAEQLTLEVGESYLLFLSGVPHHFAPVVGFAQGVYRAVTAPLPEGAPALHLLSPDGELLEVGDDGRLVRSAPWVVSEGRLVHPTPPVSRATRAEPDLVRSDGRPAPTPSLEAVTSRIPRPASIADVRRLVDSSSTSRGR